MNDSVKFEDVGNHSCVLLDAGSLVDYEDSDLRFVNPHTRESQSWQSFADDMRNDFSYLSLNEQNRLIVDMAVKMLFERDNRARNEKKALRFLEHIICYDFVVCDELAMQTRGLYGNFPLAYLKTTKIPNAVYSRAARTFEQKVPLLERIKAKLPEILFHGGDKQYHDFLHDLPTRVFTPFAHSDDSIHRAVFYLEVGRHAKAPLAVSPEKCSLLSDLEEACGKVLHERITAITSDPLREKWLQWIVKDHTPVSVTAPPLSIMILTKSLVERKTWLQAAVEIRDSEPAKAYRQWLFALNKKQLAARQPGMRPQFFKEINKLETIAKEWGKHGDSGHMVKYKHRKLDFSKLPFIGYVLEIGGIKPLEFRDPVVFTPPRSKYLAFISSWYDESNWGYSR